jgi:hypothetical protein
LSVSIVSSRTRVFDLLTAHRAVLGPTFDQLNDAELMEDMAALKLSRSDHMVLANSTILWMLNGSLYALVGRVSFIISNLDLTNNDIWINHKLDLREVFLQIGHEYLELKVLFEISVHLAYRLNQSFANPYMTNQIQVHPLNNKQEQEMEYVEHIDAEIDHELKLDHMDLVLIEVLSLNRRPIRSIQ